MNLNLLFIILLGKTTKVKESSEVSEPSSSKGNIAPKSLSIHKKPVKLNNDDDVGYSSKTTKKTSGRTTSK
jgi:hypothetical protein